MTKDVGRKEQRLLLLSASCGLVLAFVAIAIGLWTGAKSIVFDGMYSVVDVGMTLCAWCVARLIARGHDRRFQFGYWHIEPMLALLNGAVLLFACLYALVDGLSAVIAGGRAVDFGFGIAYAAIASVVSLGFFILVSRHGRGLGSTLLDLDARSWLLGGLLSAGLCLSLGAAALLEGTAFQTWAVYVDPAILIVLALALTPLPIKTIFAAGREILQIAPRDLDVQVREVAKAVARRHGFIEHRSYVVKVGRARFVEMGFVAPSAQSAVRLADLDAIRQEIAEAMGGLQPGYWLTVDFTADRRWI